MLRPSLQCLIPRSNSDTRRNSNATTYPNSDTLRNLHYSNCPPHFMCEAVAGFICVLTSEISVIGEIFSQTTPPAASETLALKLFQTRGGSGLRPHGRAYAPCRHRRRRHTKHSSPSQVQKAINFSGFLPGIRHNFPNSSARKSQPPPVFS